jgi:hypothetical protein
MTKTTNYEISKKLSEIGFKAETCKMVYEKPLAMISDRPQIGISAYDLETLLDALPSTIENIHFRMNKGGLWYENLCNCDSDQSCPVESYCHIEIKNNESLADTAGRMIIELHEKNLIKF